MEKPVAKGITHILGIDFSDSFATIINYVTLRIVLLLCLINIWDSEFIDLETGFL